MEAIFMSHGGISGSFAPVRHGGISGSFAPVRHGGISGSFAPTFVSSAKDAFKDFVRFNSRGFNAADELGITPSTPRPSSIIKLPGGPSSPFGISSSSPGPPGGAPGGSPVPGGPAGRSAPDYYQAALASHYGMDATTAYQEALANTSYQRAVQDMINAGLNPASLFAAGRVSGASGVGYATQIGSGFVPSSGGGGSARSKQVFSKGLYNALQVVGGAIAVATTKNPFAYPIGSTAAKGIMSAINGFAR